MPSVKVGNAEIISLLDLNAAFPLEAVFPGVPVEDWSPYADLYPGTVKDGMLYTNFQAFAVRSPDGVVLVDMGGGPGPHEFLGGQQGQLGNELKANGIDAADVTTVIFTHLHFDHTGWSTVDGKLFCPNARYLAPEADWPMLGKDGFPPPEALRDLRDSGRLELVSGETSLSASVTIVPTPGHTPGHQSIALVSDGQRAFIAGDLAPTQAVLQETDWVFGFDGDPPTNIATRNRIFALLEERGDIVTFGHFVTPNCIGRVVREGGRRVFKPVLG
jgi:glyoxylase-like metal-dependent hydrolase (beta-lactamase superfamily II)